MAHRVRMSQDRPGQMPEGLESENSRLRRAVADLTLDNLALEQIGPIRGVQ